VTSSDSATTSAGGAVWRFLKEVVIILVVALGLSFLVRTFIVQAFKIPSGSMKPTLLIGDHILVNKFIYGVRIPFVRKALISIGEPKREDVIVFIYPEDRSKDFIKRVVGVGGDTIEIRNKKIFLNGLPYQDNHGVYVDDFILPGSIQPRDNFGPFTVPKGTVFAMGDNRDQSYDSRFWGVVDLKDVLGKAFMLYWSWNGENHSVRWGRLGNLVR